MTENLRAAIIVFMLIIEAFGEKATLQDDKWSCKNAFILKTLDWVSSQIGSSADTPVKDRIIYDRLMERYGERYIKLIYLGPTIDDSLKGEP